MRSIAEAQNWLSKLDAYSSLDSFRDAIHGIYDDKSIAYGQRSVCWKVSLLFKTLDRGEWTKVLQTSRDAYDILRKKYITPLQYPDELELDEDPLSEVENSPWNILRKDETCRQEIFQDVERCMPDHLYFREPSTQNMLLDILFIWTKLNPDIGYRQGMHEILAPILWVVERDAIDPTSIVNFSADMRYASLAEEIFDSRHIEQDTFTLFNCIMQNLKLFYEPGPPPMPTRSAKRSSVLETPIIALSRKILEVYLQKTDPLLADHLRGIEMAPQVYLMRWIRLLFGREFPFDEVLHLWDCIFAKDPMLKCVDLICVSMMLRIRWQLIETDHKNALTLLFNYPDFDADAGPWSLVEDAIYLRDNLNSNGGAFLITKYTNRPPPFVERDFASDSPVSSPGQSLSGSPSIRPSLASSAQQRGGIESILQDAARGVYSQGERWGLNKALREAVGEVRKNVGEVRQNVKDLQARHSRNSSFAGFNHTLSSSDLMQKVDDLQARNQALASMLEVAVSELWKQQSTLSADKSPEDESTKEFTMAIAKVQFVQVYLSDPSLPLPIDEKMQSNFNDEDSKSSDGTVQPATGSPRKASNPSHYQEPSQAVQPEPLPGPAISEPTQQIQAPQPRPKRTTPVFLSTQSSTSNRPPNPQRQPPASAPSDRTEHVRMLGQGKSNPKSIEKSQVSIQNRPSLAQSSFSFMLGQDKSEFSSASPFTMNTQTFDGRRKNSDSETAFLFGLDTEKGEDGDTMDLFGRRGGAGKGSSPASINGFANGRRGSKTKDEKSTEEEAFRLGTWRR